MNKIYQSPAYNFIFNGVTGYFIRWGKTLNDDPDRAPVPEIMDIEISTICKQGCAFCYKSNTSKGEYMSLETFKKVFAKLPKSLTQIAFGIGDLTGNPDLFEIMTYTRQNGVVPNITVNGAELTDEMADKLANVCGAIAVSCYDKDVCFEAVKKLTDRVRKGNPLRQVNIHAMLSEESYDKCFSLIEDRLHDPRLEKLNAIVYLQLKPVGRALGVFHQLSSEEKFANLVKKALDNKVGIGFDSCSSPMFIAFIKKNPQFAALEKFVEPCESTLFSGYLDVGGYFHPCSFAEGREDIESINVLEVQDFKKEVWNASSTLKFAENLIKNKDCNGCRKCHLFNLTFGQ